MTAVLRIGSHVRYDGERYVLEAIRGSTIVLKSLRGVPLVVAATALFNHADFAVLDDQGAPLLFLGGEPEFALNNLTPDIRKLAEDRRSELREMLTGYRSGDPENALSNEPRPEYDPETTTLGERRRAKAKALNISVRSIERDERRFKLMGLEGLIDRRRLKLSTRVESPQMLEAMAHAFRDSGEASAITKKSRIRRVLSYLKKNYPDYTPPGRDSLLRSVNEFGEQNGYFLDTKTQRGNASRPPAPFQRFVASFMGQVVIIDSTNLDAFGYDESTGRWVQIQLTIALEVYSRSIVGWRFTPVSTKGVDAVMLLLDIISPKPLRPGWPKNAQWNYPGVPAEIVVSQLEDDKAKETTDIAAIPIVKPSSVVVDRGKIFLSADFVRACELLHISIQLARPKTPTDKAPLERTFKTINENFVELLPGYKGPNLAKRGLNVEQMAYYFLGDLDELFGYWVATYWQRRIHSGLDIPHLPKLRLCPNDMYNNGISQTGLMHVVADRDLYFRLLPVHWRSVKTSGVKIGNLWYDHSALNELRNESSAYTGKNQGRYPFRVDPRDMSRIYFFDELSRKWQEVPWRGSTDKYRPFNSSTLKWVKTLIVEQAENPHSDKTLEDALNDWLDYLETGELRGSRELKEAARRGIEAAQAKEDRLRYGGAVESLKSDSEQFDDEEIETGEDEQEDDLLVDEIPIYSNVSDGEPDDNEFGY